MFGNREFAAAMAVMAAVSGVGFASGREIVLFFAQLGWVAWPGMLIAAALFALLLRIAMGLARKTGASSLPGMFQRLMGSRSGDVVGVLYGLLMAFTAAMMLRTCGELGAIALPVKNGYLQGILLALFMAVAVCMGRMHFLPVLGALAVITAILFYGGLLLDARPVRVHMRSETVLNLSGSLWGALILGILHACLNASVAGGTAAAFSGGNFDPGKASVMAGGMMLACLLCGHGAMLRGGEALYAQTLPSVILAARWGIWGFWLSVGFMFLTSICTLSAAMGAIAIQLSGTGRQRRVSGIMLLMAFLFLFAMGSDTAMGFGYPVLGWICAFSLGALACWQDEKNCACKPRGDVPSAMQKMPEIDVKF